MRQFPAFAEIYVTTSGGPGSASSTLTWLIYKIGLFGDDIGGAAAGGVVAIVFSNIVVFFLMRIIDKNLRD